MAKEPQPIAGGRHDNSFAMSFFSDMPGWARTVVFGLCIIPIAFAISGMILNVNVGAHLDRYMEIQLEQARTTNAASTAEIIGAIELQFADMTERMSILEIATDENTSKVDALENWVCVHGEVQGLKVDTASWCKE